MSISRIGDGVPLNEKGQILSHNGTTMINIPVGTDGQILTSQSSTTSGLEWATPSAGDTQYVSVIANATLTASSHSITFSSIPSTYDELIIVLNARRGDTTTATSCTVQINSDTTSSYRGASYDQSNGQQTTTSQAYLSPFYVNGSTHAPVEIHIPNYKNSYSPKVVASLYGFVGSLSGNGGAGGSFWGCWTKSDAITSITVYAGTPSATTTTFGAVTDAHFAILYGVNRS